MKEEGVKVAFGGSEQFRRSERGEGGVVGRVSPGCRCSRPLSTLFDV